MPTMTFNTSNDGKLRLGEGFSLLNSNTRALNLAYEKSFTLLDKNGRGSWGWYKYKLFIKGNFFAGVAGPGYALNSKVNATISKNANNVPTQGTFRFGGDFDNNDGVAAGIKIGISLSIEINIYFDVKFLPSFSTNLSLSFDVISFVLSLLIDKANGDRGKNGKVQGDGGLNFYDEVYGELRLNGISDGATPSITVKFNLATVWAPMKAIDKGLQKLKGGFGFGPFIKLGFPVIVKPTHIYHDGYEYPLTEMDNNDEIVVNNPSRNTAYGQNSHMRIEHRVGVGIGFGAYAEFSVIKVISLGIEFEYLFSTGVSKTLSNVMKANSVTAGIPGEISAPQRPILAEKPRVIFDALLPA
jgi:hypothetical protein